jgi:hypothetical protein
VPIIDDPRYTSDLIVGQVRQQLMPTPKVAAPEPDTLSTLAAASRQSTLAGAAYARLTTLDPDLPDAPPDYDPLEHVQGFEQFAERFIDATTPSEVEGIKQRLQDEQSDREVLQRAGLGGTGTQIALNLVDPSFLVAAAVPELGLAKAARVGRIVQAATEGVAGAAAYETAMHQLQEGRTLEESAFSIGGGALLSGVLGSLGRRMPRDELKVVGDSIRSEVGAASSTRPTTLAEESFSGGGETLSKIAGKVPLTETDLQKVMRADSIAARTTLQDLADVAPILQKNVEGVATPTSVESLVRRHEGRIADFSDRLAKLWTDYRATTPRAERMPKKDFYAAVSSAARRGDEDLVPQIAEGARYLRSRVFDPLKEEAQHLGLLPKDVQVVGAESYFRRMYDREAIRKNRREWDSVLTRHFYRSQGVEYAEARSIAEDVTRRILGGDVGQANFNLRTVQNAGPLHDRVLDVPDEMIERFLVNDPVKVASAYVRELAPQIEITRRFGDRDMKGALDKVRDEYTVLRERVRGGVVDAAHSKALTQLQDQERDTLQALVRIRDRIYGRAGRLGPNAGEGERRAVMAARGWRNLTGAAKLGGTAITGGVTDLARIVAQYGFMPTMAKLTKLVSSKEFRDLSKNQARRLGAAVEVAMSRRVHVVSDGAITEGWTQKLAEGVFKYTGLNHITDTWRTLSATLLEDTVLKAAADVSAGKALPAWTRTRLASLGIDEDAFQRIHQQVLKHGGEVDGVRVSGSADWDDADLAELYDAAILKESRITVMEPGAADRTWWLDSETGKVIGQLKAFSLASPMKLLAAPVQMVGHGQYLQAARFAGAMMIGGYLAHSLRQFAAGRQPTTDVQGAANEAFTESGLAGVLPDVVSPLGRRLGLWGESARFSDRNVMGAYGGPAIGTLADAYDLAFNRTADGMSAKDLQLLRRLLPYQNVWWLRRAVNALEGETAEALNLEGADTSSFGERFLETKPLLPSSERGGTGTGQLVQ